MLYVNSFRIPIIIYSVIFFSLISCPTFNVPPLNLLNYYFNLVWDFTISTTLSAYAIKLMVEFCSFIPLWCSIFIHLITFSNPKLNRMGDKESSCFKSDFTVTGPEFVFLTLFFSIVLLCWLKLNWLVSEETKISL